MDGKIPNSAVQFGVFEVDLRAHELRKSGMKIRIQEQPFQLLVLLLERRESVLSRQELRARLWPNGTFVDFEHGLNAAVKRLRDVLGDDANNPRFIETVPRRGYKFIAPVNDASATTIAKARPLQFHFPRLRLLIVAGLPVILAAIAAGWWFWPSRTPQVTRSTRLSFGERAAPPFPMFGEVFPTITTDGSRIYFSMVRDATLKLGYVSVAGGDQVPLPIPLENAELRHISPDGSQLLAYASIAGESEKHLWLASTAEGGLRRLSGVDGHDGAWSPDGRHLLYAQEHEVYVAEHDGSNSRKLMTTSGKAFWLRWSPDGTRIRFTLVDPTSSARTLWECRADGSDLHRLSISWAKQPDECCGEWAPDGKHFYFRTFLDARTEIWAIREPRFPQRTHKPVQLSTGPIVFASLVPSRNGKQLLTVGVQPKWEVLSYEPKTRNTTHLLPEVSAFGPSLSRDLSWIAYVERVEGRGKGPTLWRSKLDGSERLQLSEPPLFVGPLRWSPDSTQIAFMGKTRDKPWNIYLVARSGGAPRALLNDGRNAVDPEWSPDGSSLMFGRPPEYWAEAGQPKAIHTLDLTSNQISKLPDSDGLYSPRWSPNGRYVVAMPLDEKKLVLFDFAARRWKDFAAFPHIGSPQWSPDSEYVYIDGFDNEVVRIRRRDGKLEKILDLKTVDPNALLCYFGTVASDGKLLLACPLARGDIYALDLDFL